MAVSINKVKKPPQTMADMMKGRVQILNAVWDLFIENDESIAIVCHSLADYNYAYHQAMQAMAQTYSLEKKSIYEHSSEGNRFCGRV